MELFDEFEYEGKHYVIEIEELLDGIYFFVKEKNDGYLMKFSANFWNLSDNIKASRTKLSLYALNLKEELKSLIIGFITRPTED
jgi:hypothetical protein